MQRMSTPTGSQPIPLLSRLGGLAMLVGLLYDLVEHTLVTTAATTVAGFAAGEHAAHLIVIVGMIGVLAGVMVDGHRSARRPRIQTRSNSDAIR
jgi:hypothetical protein